MKVNNLHVTSIKLPPALLKALDKWCLQQEGPWKPNRSEAIRYMIEQHLQREKEIEK